ncbi:MAG: toll/interleukin-1 receptor domain-containing protein [Thiolinea sp.]
MPSRTRVFISYSHDSEEHTQFVLELAERLLEDGFNCVLDFYLEEAPSEGWDAWLEAELVAADITLVICTPTYLQRYQHNQMLDNDAAEFTGLVITQDIYARFAKQTKFVPILPPEGKLHDIIPPLQGQNAFELMTDYLGLHQLLRNAPLKTAKVERQTVNFKDNDEALQKSLKTDDTLLVNHQTPSASEENKQLFYWLILAAAILLIIIGVFIFR